MPKTHPAYAPEFRRQMVELVRSGRDPADLAREFERKRSQEAHLPARVLNVLGRLGVEGFELSLWTTIMTARRVAATAGSRF